MSSRLFQGVIYQMKEAINRVIGIIDSEGVIIACSDLSKIGEVHMEVHEEMSYVMDTLKLKGYTYRPVGSKVKIEYIVFCDGEDDQAVGYASLIGIAITNIKQYYDEKYDKTYFIKNVLLDNILPGDTYLKSKELHFGPDVMRAVLLVRFVDISEVSVYDIVQNIFPDKTKDFVVNISETDIAIVKEVKANTTAKDLEKLAKSIVETLSGEFYTKAYVGIGTVAETLKELNLAFKEAQTALDVGKVFENDKMILSYENLGIGRLIYQLPNVLCEMFLQEVFRRGSIELLDQETLFTIQKFFENSLNVSETARKLFVHRNTLVYRLEKVKKLIGLDLREFEDAIIFKVAIMVKKYLDSKNV